MSENGDVQVKMTVSLDESDLEQQVSKAENRLNKSGKIPGSGKPSSDGGKEQREKLDFIKKLSGGISSSLQSVMSGSATGAAGAAGGVGSVVAGGLAGGLAGAVVGVVVSSAVKLAEGLKSLVGTLSKYNPVLAYNSSMLSLQMRGLNISLGRVLQGPLSGLQSVVSELMHLFGGLAKLIGALLGPTLSNFLEKLRLITKVLSLLVDSVNWVIGFLYKSIGQFGKWLVSWLPDSMSAGMKKLADDQIRVGEELMHPNDLQSARDQNRAFIDALSKVTEPGKSEKPPGDGSQSSGPDERPTYPSAPEIPESRIADQVPKPPSVTVNQKVDFNLQMKLAHEQAVQTAIEQVRSSIISGLNVVRNETYLMGNMMMGRSNMEVLL